MTDKSQSSLTLVTADTGDEFYVVRDGNSRRADLAAVFRPSAISPTYPGLNLNSGAVINWASGDVTLTHSSNTLTFAGATSGYLFGELVAPSANDVAALGSTTLSWSDLFLADGGVINWGAGGVTGTHAAASDSLTLALDASNLLASTTLTLAVDGTSLVALAATALSPATNDVAALGTTALGWADLHLADGGVVNWGNGGVTVTHAAASDSLTLALDAANLLAATQFIIAIDGGNELVLDAANLKPGADDGLALGASSTAFADLFLADGAVINFDAGTATVTHVSASNSLTIAADPGNALASTVITFQIDGASEAILSATNFTPGADDGNALGASGTAWADVFLASGAVINFNAGDVTLTHAVNTLTFAGASSGYTFDALVTTTVAGNTARFVNSTDAASVQVARFEGDRATMADNDEAYLSLMLSNDGGTQTEFARLTWVATDVNAATSVDAALVWSVALAGTLTAKLRLEDSVLSPSASDGTALGSTSLMWSDLFLASGAVVNFAASDWVATHTAGILTVGTGDLRVTTAGTNTASVVTVGGTQTLTAKTLTSPTIGTSPTAAGATWTSLGTVTTADINGGTLDGTVIGGASAAAATVTTLTTTGTAYIGDTSNANVTLGLTLNQGAADNQIIAFKSSDVAHGVTGTAETDTYGFVQKWLGGGGLYITGLINDGGANWEAVVIEGIGQGDDGKATSSHGIVSIDAYENNATATKAALAANTNLLAVRTGTTTRFMLDSDGDSHQDVGTAWTNFDHLDDVATLNALAYNVARPDDPIRTKFGVWMQEKRAILQAQKIVTFNDDGHHFVNMSKLAMLHTGAIRQLGEALAERDARIAALEQRLAALPVLN